MDNNLKEILIQCSVSTQLTAQVFFPERFYLPFAKEVHGKIFDLIDGPANKVCIAAPRGWGKTSIAAQMLPPPTPEQIAEQEKKVLIQAKIREMAEAALIAEGKLTEK